jgi:hypothetical protein
VVIKRCNIILLSGTYGEDDLVAYSTPNAITTTLTLNMMGDITTESNTPTPILTPSLPRWCYLPTLMTPHVYRTGSKEMVMLHYNHHTNRLYFVTRPALTGPPRIFTIAVSSLYRAAVHDHTVEDIGGVRDSNDHHPEHYWSTLPTIDNVDPTNMKGSLSVAILDSRIHVFGSADGVSARWHVVYNDADHLLTMSDGSSSNNGNKYHGSSCLTTISSTCSHCNSSSSSQW